jgi:hypothetical protein
LVGREIAEGQVRGTLMQHTIRFSVAFVASLETALGNQARKVLLREGGLFRVRLKPYVVETKGGPVEVADLYFDDGTTTRQVPFGFFHFVDQDPGLTDPPGPTTRLP